MKRIALVSLDLVVVEREEKTFEGIQMATHKLKASLLHFLLINSDFVFINFIEELHFAEGLSFCFCTCPSLLCVNVIS